MKTLPTTAAAVLLFFCAALASCQKDGPDSPNLNNPPELSLPGTGFTVTVLDCERGHDPDSDYVFEGVWRDGHFRFGRERLDTMQLNISPGNAIILKISSENPDFQGVNAASSTRAIDIVADGTDCRQYHLERVCEGASTITLWNGEGSTRQEIRFTATSREDIPAEGILIRIDGEEYLMSGEFNSAGSLSGLRVGLSPSAWPPYLHDLVKVFPGRREDDWTDHVDLEIAGCVPLNATSPVFTTACDLVGIIDEKAHRSSLPTTNPATGEAVYRWMRISSLYEENLAHNPDFRWFPPVYLTPQLYEAYRNEKLLAPYYAGESEYRLAPTAEDGRYRFNPADLRERRAWVWCPPGTTEVGIAFGTGTFCVSVMPGDGVGIHDRYDSCTYDRVFQVWLEFRDRIEKPLDEKWPLGL
ncbi:MAG: hypothetical protein IKX28_08340 [Bacteroidales bacterium]|nr:hypothetical protein [Bacteroidales bacterium]